MRQNLHLGPRLGAALQAATRSFALGLFAAATIPLSAAPGDLIRELARPDRAAPRPSAEGPRVVRSRFAALNARLLEDGGRKARLNLFPDVDFELEDLVSKRSLDGETTVWSGKGVDHAGRECEVYISGRGGKLFANISSSDGRYYKIRPAGEDGAYEIREEEYFASTMMRHDAVPAPKEIVSKEDDRAPAAQALSAAEQSVTQVDLLVVYSLAAKNAAGGKAAIESLAELTVAEANQGLQAAAINARLRLVAARELAIPAGEVASGSYLTTVTLNSEIKALREETGADVVSVWINGQGSNGGVVGIGWIMQNAGSGFAALAYNIVEVNFADGPAYTLAHEIGHNLGAQHDRENSGGQRGAFDYSFGYQQDFNSPRFRTIMGQGAGCSGGCASRNLWSNPNVSYSGNAAGVASGPLAADNARTLNQTAPIAAAWRAEKAAADAPPTADAVSPSSGSGEGALFVYRVSDPNGRDDVDIVQAVFNETLTATNSCYLNYVARQNRLYLLNDAGTAWLGPATPGSSAALENSKCRVNLAGSSVGGSGSTLTLSLDLKFKQPGQKTNWLAALDSNRHNTGWQAVGTWTAAAGTAANAPPTADAVSPSSGSGGGGAFVYRFSDPNGRDDIGRAEVIVNETLGVSNSCYLAIEPAANRVFLRNDASTAWLGPVTLGSSGFLENSKCRVNGAGSAVGGADTTLTATLDIQFAVAGSKSQWSRVQETSGAWIPWKLAGSWTATVQTPSAGPSAGAAFPSADAVSPSSGSGEGALFVYRVSDPDGRDDVDIVQAVVNETLTATNSCYLNYVARQNRLYLLNDAGTAWLGPATPGSSAVLENSKCRVNLAGSSVGGSGSTLTLSLDLKFKQPGQKTNWLAALDSNRHNTGWQALGTWTAAAGTAADAPPTADAVSPSSGSGAGARFVYHVSDPDGRDDVDIVQAVFNETLTVTNSCYLNYVARQNRLYLLNDAGTAWLGPAAPGSSAVLENSKCRVNLAGSSVGGSGSTLTLSLDLKFKTPGRKTNWLAALDSNRRNTGWQAVGTWTAQ